MKIVVLDGKILNPGDLSWHGFNDLGELTIYENTMEELIIERIADAEIVLINQQHITKDIILSCPQLRYIGILATGFNIIDLEAAKNAGIVVTNIPTYGTHAVAQYAMALLLELCHHVGSHSDYVKSIDWSKNNKWFFWNHPLTDLEYKTIGIIGFGKIGQTVAKMAQGFGLTVLAYDNYKNMNLETPTCHYAELDEIYANADIISIHCPLFPSTKGLINKHSIAQMKDGVMIINTSRGEIIVEEDLRIALDSGKVAGAAVDVLSAEPIRMDNPLLEAKNILITPHIAWATKESRTNLMELAVDNLRKYLQGIPQNVVNP